MIVPALYINQGGLTACAEHGGMSLKAYAAEVPPRHGQQFDAHDNWLTFTKNEPGFRPLTCEQCGATL